MTNEDSDGARVGGDDVAAVSDVDTPPARPSKAPTVLIVIATVLAVISSITTWVHTDALDTDAWVNTSEELLNNDEVTTAVATYLVNELYTQVDVPGELEQLLPGDLSGVAAALSGALREPVTNGIERVLESPQFAEIWVRANRVAHEALVAILRDETLPAVSTADGAVTLDLREAIVNVGTEIGLPQAALDRIPEGAGQITIFQSDELKDVQNYVRVLDFLSWFLFLLTVGLYVLAVYLAAPRRRRALSMVGWSLVVYGITLYVLTGLGVRTGIDYYVDDNTNTSLANAIATIATDLLRQFALAGIVYGVLIIAFAALLGPHRWAVALRRYNPITTPATAAGGALVLALIVLWWSPGNAFNRWYTALTVLALIAGAMAALAIQAGKDADAQDNDDDSGVDAAGDNRGEEALTTA
jgi:hypothetical protein